MYEDLVYLLKRNKIVLENFNELACYSSIECQNCDVQDMCTNLSDIVPLDMLVRLEKENLELLL